MTPVLTIGDDLYEDYEAAAGLFAITDAEAEFLFSPEAYLGDQVGAAGERFVAKRIRDFVAGKAQPES